MDFLPTNTSCYSLKSCVSMYATSRKPAWPLDSSNARLWAQWFFKNIVFDGVLAHHLNIWEAFRFTFDVACSPRTQEITRSRSVKVQWQSLHRTILLLYKISVLLGLWWTGIQIKQSLRRGSIVDKEDGKESCNTCQQRIDWKPLLGTDSCNIIWI